MKLYDIFSKAKDECWFGGSYLQAVSYLRQHNVKGYIRLGKISLADDFEFLAWYSKERNGNILYCPAFKNVEIPPHYKDVSPFLAEQIKKGDIFICNIGNFIYYFDALYIYRIKVFCNDNLAKLYAASQGMPLDSVCYMVKSYLQERQRSFVGVEWVIGHEDVGYLYLPVFVDDFSLFEKEGKAIDIWEFYYEDLQPGDIFIRKGTVWKLVENQINFSLSIELSSLRLSYECSN